MPVEARRVCEVALRRAGMSSQDAGLVAESLVLAQMRGLPSHGLVRLPAYVERLRRGGIKARPCIRVERELGATGVIDGDGGHGIPVGVAAMDFCLELAERHGIAAVGVRRSGHFGMGYFLARRALSRDMVGVAVANGDALIAPWGAADRYFGTNPIAVCVPAGEEPPIALDMASSTVAAGAMMLAAARGQPLPAGWAMDRQGRPTTDPAEALAGALLPFGGYKGSAIALLIEILCGPLTGALIGPDIAPLHGAPERPQELGHLFMALDVRVFTDIDTFKRRVDAMIRSIRNLRRAEGCERILLPGDRERDSERVAECCGMWIEADTWRRALWLAGMDGAT